MYDLDDSEEDSIDALPDFMKHDDPDPDALETAADATPDTDSGEPDGGDDNGKDDKE